MTDIYYLFLLLSLMIYYVTEISIFSFLSDIKLALWKQIFVLTAALFLNQFALLPPLIIDPLLLLAVLALEKRPCFSLKALFLAFVPGVFVDLLSRFILAIVLPYIFSVNGSYVRHLVLDFIAYVMIFPSFALINYFVGKDYKQIVKADRFDKASSFYGLFLLFSLAYYIDLFMILGFTDPFLDLKSPIMMSTSYKVLFLIFTLLLIYLLSYFNHQSKEFLKQELKKEQQVYIANLETYGKHLEKLYKGVKVFQLDYLKRLERLGQAIDSGSVSEVQTVYAQTVDEATDYWDDKHYNISKLSKISVSSIKSLLSSKIIKAEKAGIALSLEVPDRIRDSYISELDLLLLVSIFCDNAIEAALETAQPAVAIAYFLSDDQQIFTVTNTTKDERVMISRIFEEGYSSKGSGRGIGLSNAKRILQKYPELSLRTRSHDYQFSQTLIMPKIEKE